MADLGRIGGPARLSCRLSHPGLRKSGVLEAGNFIQVLFLISRMRHRQDRDSVPTGRHVIATDASPWSAKNIRGEVLKGRQESSAQSPVVPLGLKYAAMVSSTDSRPWLSPVTTPWLKHNLNSLVTFQSEQIPDTSKHPNLALLRSPVPPYDNCHRWAGLPINQRFFTPYTAGDLSTFTS